jgi:hypothetical protein
LEVALAWEIARCHNPQAQPPRISSSGSRGRRCAG